MPEISRTLYGESENDVIKIKEDKKGEKREKMSEKNEGLKKVKILIKSEFETQVEVRNMDIEQNNDEKEYNEKKVEKNGDRKVDNDHIFPKIKEEPNLSIPFSSLNDPDCLDFILDDENFRLHSDYDYWNQNAPKFTSFFIEEPPK